MFEEFFDAARQRLGDFIPASTPSYDGGITDPSQSTIGGSVFEAIYQAARGYSDKARDTLTSRFLATGEGQRIQASATKQTLMQWAPVLAVVVILVVVFGYALGRR